MAEDTDKREATEEEDDSWFFGAEEGNVKQKEEEERIKALSGMRRFWIPPDKDRETRITFIDDTTKPSEGMAGRMPPFHVKEHQMFLNGHWRNWFTCIGSGCPLCWKDKQENPNKEPSLCAVYTIVDHSEWKDKQGKTHKDELKLFVAKQSAMRRLKKLAEKYEGMRGLVLDVSRLSDKEPNVGGHFDYHDKIDGKAMGELAKKVGKPLEPAEYMKIFKPRKKAELKAIVGIVEEEEDEIEF